MEPVPSLLARIFATTQLININSAKVRESLQGLAIQVRHREGKPSRVFIDGKEKLGFELKTRDRPAALEVTAPFLAMEAMPRMSDKCLPRNSAL
jgi:hypothetical protein